MNIFESLHERSQCKGRYFRGYVTRYKTKYGFAEKVEVRPLQRMSCPGCEHCGWIEDDLNNGLELGYLSFEGIEDGKIYMLQSFNEHRDWETGIVDEYDLKFVEI